MKVEINKAKIKITVILFLLLSSSYQLKAQNYSDIASYGQATIDTKCVTIDDSTPLKQYYVIDISHFNFTNYDDAFDVFGYISNNYLTYRVDFEHQVAFLEIHADRTPELQDVSWWKNYILNLCTTY